MKVVTWGPDTCNCIFKMEYDETQANPTYTLKEVVRVCGGHVHLNPNDELTCVFDENRLKNATMTAIRDNVPELQETDADGNVRLKRDEVSFKFEGTAPNRTLRVTTKTDISSHEQAIKDQVASDSVVV